MSYGVCVPASAIWLEELAATMTFASPKSRILACPRLVTKMFAGLMSRWDYASGISSIECIGDPDSKRQYCPA